MPHESSTSRPAYAYATGKRTQLVKPESHEQVGADFAFNDLVSVRGLLALLDQGVPLRRIRRHVESMRQHLPEIR